MSVGSGVGVSVGAGVAVGVGVGASVGTAVGASVSAIAICSSAIAGVGCAASTGEEPYSMAIAACEAFGTLAPPVRILATDIDTQVLATAAQGMYRLERIAGLDPALVRKYFLRGTGPRAGWCRLRPELLALLEFRPLNLLQPRYEAPLDVVALFCRNVMIYFDKPTQRTILSRLVAHLAAEGVLYTGHSENYLHAADLIVPCGRTLYRRAPGAPA